MKFVITNALAQSCYVSKQTIKSRTYNKGLYVHMCMCGILGHFEQVIRVYMYTCLRKCMCGTIYIIRIF